MSLLPPGLQLNADNVVRLLLKTSKDWKLLARQILVISYSKLDEIERCCLNVEECLKEATEFWLKRFVYASWRWIILFLDYRGYMEVADEVRPQSEPLFGKILLPVFLVSFYI